MPHLFPFASHASEDGLQEMGDDPPPKRPHRPFLRNIAGLWRRHHDHDHDHDPRDAADPSPHTAPPEPPAAAAAEDYFELRRSSLPDDCAPRKPITSLPRQQTFARQDSEKRDNLLEVPPSHTERRAVSVDRRRGLSASAARRSFSPNPLLPSVSAPEIAKPDQDPKFAPGSNESSKDVSQQSNKFSDLTPLQIPDLTNGDVEIYDEEDDRSIDQTSLQDEYDRRWILNLSMHFRDKSNREKFFVTYAQTPTRWRRLTISLDYRNAPEGSLEADLSTLHFQRDKSFQIYQAIRESLPEIQYYNTVTNLKLETTPEDGQLHVHVREDANEIIRYPSKGLFEHVQVKRYHESEVELISHLSGFVYKVRTAEDKILIKKEIPGPDNIDEFLYEVNALDSLLGCRRVVQLEGLVVDDSGDLVKGLLISYASNGALVDVLYEERDRMEWHRREKWAKQIVEGLSDIHEAGFVQGDFTLSNIVIDEFDDAVIIDINRRGCPVGWEPPELSRLIESGQRIGMCIGVKTDLFQLGMVLWALAEIEEEPERCDRPLPCLPATTPTYYRRMVESCLSVRPQGRSSAKRLLRKFPQSAGRPPSRRLSNTVDFTEDVKLSDHSVSSHRSDKEYIDPDMAITLEDVHSERRRQQHRELSPFTSEQVTYFDPQDPQSNPASTSYRFESSGSWIVGRGRSPVSGRRRTSSPYARTASSSSATSLSGRSPPSRSQRRCGSESSETDQVQVSPPGEVIEPVNGTEVPAITIETEDQQPLRNKLLTDLQHEEDLQQPSPFLHTDSGFDEQMTEELDHDPAPETSLRNGESSVTCEGRPEYSHHAIHDKENQPPASADLPEQYSFHTCLETPSREIQKKLDTAPEAESPLLLSDQDSATAMEQTVKENDKITDTRLLDLGSPLEEPTPIHTTATKDFAPTGTTDSQPIPLIGLQAESTITAEAEAEPGAHSEYYEARQT